MQIKLEKRYAKVDSKKSVFMQTSEFRNYLSKIINEKEKRMDIITEAKRQVFLTGRLDFPDRQKLWRALGEAKYDEEGYAIRTKGLIRRVKLARACVKRILPIWNKYRKGDRRPFYILKLVDSYLKGEITNNRLQEIFDGSILKFDEFASSTSESGSCKNYMEVGGMATRIVRMALYDDRNLYIERTDNDPVDLINDYDIARYIYFLYDIYIQYDEKKSRIEKEKEYWLWYINEVEDLMEESEIEYSIF